MVFIANFWMTHTLAKAISIASQQKIPLPDFIKKYIDDVIALISPRPDYNET
jgi:hypothetical protein